jgi:hypothetical protein
MIVRSSEDALRVLVVRGLGGGHIGNDEWAQLKALDFVQVALSTLEVMETNSSLQNARAAGDAWKLELCNGQTADAVTELVGQVRLIRALNKQPKNGHIDIGALSDPSPIEIVPDGVPALQLTKEESAHTHALSVFQAAQASKLPEVRGFRERYLGGHPHPIRQDAGQHIYARELNDLKHKSCRGGHVLTEREALRFLRSPALACFAGHILAAYEVPFLSHRAFWPDRTSRTVEPGKAIRVYTRGGRNQHLTVPPEPIVQTLKVAFPLRGRYIDDYEVPVESFSVLGDLYLAGVTVAFHHPRWSEATAVWWVLTGKRIPRFTPFHVTIQGPSQTGYVRIDAPHWVEPERVKEIFTGYRSVRGRSRSRDLRTLEITFFVLAHFEPDGELRAEWHVLWKSWNTAAEAVERKYKDANGKEGPKWTYDRCCDFKQTFNRGLKTLQGR